MLEAGYIYRLIIDRETSAGLYLTNEDDDDVLLPFKCAPPDFAKGDEIDVFIYHDSENRLISTTRLPVLECGQFGFVQARDVGPFGAFMDIGTDKDILVPYKEQKEEMVAGRSYVIYMFSDPQTGRIVGSAHISKYLNGNGSHYQINDEVDIMIYESTDLGWNAIVDQKYRGLLYENEVFHPIKYGDQLKAYIKQVREDNKIDIKLRKGGYVHISSTSDRLMVTLREHNGFLPLHDKSNPELIYKTLGMSKKSFKQSIGLLYKERLISIEKDGIRLLHFDAAKE